MAQLSRPDTYNKRKRGPCPGTYHQHRTASDIPFMSSFRVLRLNCLHHDTKSRFDGGELEGTRFGEIAGS